MHLPTNEHPIRVWLVDTRDGGHSGGETPGHIPNPEAKPSSADGTAPGRVWESRTPPNTNHTIEGHPNRVALELFPDRSFPAILAERACWVCPSVVCLKSFCGCLW
jgi:hypothetical protein